MTGYLLVAHHEQAYLSLIDAVSLAALMILTVYIILDVHALVV
jgi:hypothetical protein